MPLTISGDTPNFSAATITTGTITTATITTGTVTTLNAPSGVLATQNGMTGIPKAWVQFNGQGTVTINGSFNVSSITDNGTGDYTVNFTTAMPNINYSAVVSCSQNGTYGGIVGQPFSTTVGGNLTQAPTTTTARIVLVQPNVGPVDSTYVCVSVFSS